MLNATLEKKLCHLNMGDKKRVNLDNDSEVAIKLGVTEETTKVATELGIDISATGFTVTIALNRDGKAQVYYPRVGLSETGEAALLWGDLEVSINDLAKPFTLVELDERVYAEFELEDSFVTFALIVQGVKKGDKTEYPELATLKKAHKAGKLYTHLARPLVMAQPLKKLPEGGTYLVTGVETYEYEGKPKHSIVLTDEAGVKVGKFRANTTMERELQADHGITASTPGTLIVAPKEEWQTTKNGNVMVPCYLQTPASEALRAELSSFVL